ncbi:hypothetical protein CIHG_05834 [Coccidioides immitis H538.4]|uniref:Uncharacterized protein n=2 Tax=Coccidioides immitis TaxID=5501 RepID=A0A0J8QW18_COCIT|nr:hypothetical protein CISG_00989 [Coccidioides immitis RMSCC 3703]KMU88066.1 hypothetical protein CIHG_05834 [Coccidioides immitis H538.4]
MTVDVRRSAKGRRAADTARNSEFTSEEQRSQQQDRSRLLTLVKLVIPSGASNLQADGVGVGRFAGYFVSIDEHTARVKMFGLRRSIMQLSGAHHRRCRRRPGRARQSSGVGRRQRGVHDCWSSAWARDAKDTRGHTASIRRPGQSAYPPRPALDHPPGQAIRSDLVLGTSLSTVKNVGRIQTAALVDLRRTKTRAGMPMPAGSVCSSLASFHAALGESGQNFGLKILLIGNPLLNNISPCPSVWRVPSHQSTGWPSFVRRVAVPIIDCQCRSYVFAATFATCFTPSRISDPLTQPSPPRP